MHPVKEDEMGMKKKLRLTETMRTAGECVCVCACVCVVRVKVKTYRNG